MAFIGKSENLDRSARGLDAVIGFGHSIANIAVLSFNWAWGFGCAFGRNVVSAGLGTLLAGLFTVGMVAALGGLGVGISSDYAMSQMFAHSHLVASAVDSFSQGAAGAGGHANKKEAAQTVYMIIRLFSFLISFVGFYALLRSDKSLKRWWNNQGRFSLRPNGKEAIENTWFSLVALWFGMAGIVLLVHSAGFLTSNDATVMHDMHHRGTFPGMLPTVEGERSDYLSTFCVGLFLSGASFLVFGWYCFALVRWLARGLRSLVVRKPS